MGINLQVRTSPKPWLKLKLSLLRLDVSPATLDYYVDHLGGRRVDYMEYSAIVDGMVSPDEKIVRNILLSYLSIPMTQWSHFTKLNSMFYQPHR